MARLTDSQIAEIRATHPIESVANVRLRRTGGKLVGPCPLCGGNERSGTRFEIRGEAWMCAVCGEGGDVIKLVQLMRGLPFREAAEALGVGLSADPEEEARRKAERAAAKRQADAVADQHRERERVRLYRWWRQGMPWRGTPVEDYLSLRAGGVRLPADLRLRLRHAPNFAYFAPVRRSGPAEPVVVHRGPAMLGAFTDADGIFRGLHITWLDLARPNGKAEITDPETGEVLPAKKMRGSKKGTSIRLHASREPHTMIAAEGIENAVLALVALVACGGSVEGIDVAAAGDLGNLGGKALHQVRHPDLTTKDSLGRARPVFVPDEWPNLSEPAMPVADSVRDLVLIKDGDSEPLLTANALARCARRNARAGRAIRVADPGVGVDLADLFKSNKEGFAA